MDEQSNTKQKWQEFISIATEQSKAPEQIEIFASLEATEAHRASYFAEMAGVIDALGLSNPHEKSALSLEPTHPVQSLDIPKAFQSLGFDALSPSLLQKKKLSLISLKLLTHYCEDSAASKMTDSGLRDPYYLLDPLYGFVFNKGQRDVKGVRNLFSVLPSSSTW